MKPAWLISYYVLATTSTFSSAQDEGVNGTAVKPGETRQFGLNFVAVNAQVSPAPLIIFPAPTTTESPRRRWLWWFIWILVQNSQQQNTQAAAPATVAPVAVTPVTAFVPQTTTLDYRGWFSVPLTGCRYNYFEPQTYVGARDTCERLWSSRVAYRGYRAGHEQDIVNAFATARGVMAQNLGEHYVGLDGLSGAWRWSDNAVADGTTNTFFPGHVNPPTNPDNCVILANDGVTGTPDDCTTPRYFLCEICP